MGKCSKFCSRLSALRHDMLSNDTMAGEFATILNLASIFPVLSTAVIGIPSNAITDPTGGAAITDPTGGAYITES